MNTGTLMPPPPCPPTSTRNDSFFSRGWLALLLAWLSAVAGGTVSAAPSFLQDIEPILTKTGCNSGGCHGKLAGQNGFRLSLRGFAPEWDHEWITSENRARRINPAFPEESLLIQKATGRLPHEGGVRFRPGSRYEKTLLEWIALRSPGPDPAEATPVALEVTPAARTLSPGQSVQLQVNARYSDGTLRDVTWLAQFFSNDEALTQVNPAGLAKVLRPGESAVRVHFQSLVEVARFSAPFSADVSLSDFDSASTPLDGPLFAKLRELRIPPSARCDDATFLRRASLDATGCLPDPARVKTFLADNSPDKRTRFVEELLSSPAWTDYWTLQLADLLQNRKERDHDVRGSKSVRLFHAWLRERVAQNAGWDRITRDVLLSAGDSFTQPATGYFITVIGEKKKVEESELPDSVAQSFLGTRIGCARCHNHPLERFTQDDFYHFSAFFAKTTLKRGASARYPTELLVSGAEELEQHKRVEEAFGRLAQNRGEVAALGEEHGSVESQKSLVSREKEHADALERLSKIQARAPGVVQPRTGRLLGPRTLDGSEPAYAPASDAREAFVDWMLASDTFAGAMVNRIWKHFFQTGLVEPVDDLRASNPPSNGALWNVLVEEFRSHRFDLKHLMRTILNSRAYQLASDSLPENRADSRFYSHYLARRLPAEVLLDALHSATGVPTAFEGAPLGVRAVQLAEPGVSSYFLTLFGRSERVTACACERAGEVTLPQLLHLKNSEDLQTRLVKPGGRLDALLKQGGDPEVLRELFLATLNRAPTPAEETAFQSVAASGDRTAVFTDLFWALLNSKEFVFNH
jgi:hypothetical protein